MKSLAYNYKNFHKKYIYKKCTHPQFIQIRKQVKHSKLFLLLYKKPLNYIPWIKNKSWYCNTSKILSLNYKRNRFFPVLRTLSGSNYTFLSLGMFIKFFKKNKSFIKTKSMYLLLASFLRKLLLFSSFKQLILNVNKTPLFLKEILNVLNTPVTTTYHQPFNSNIIIDEKLFTNPFKFPYILFSNNKPFGPLKLKKKGRLKRKITKKITLINRVTD